MLQAAVLGVGGYITRVREVISRFIKFVRLYDHSMVPFTVSHFAQQSCRIDKVCIHQHCPVLFQHWSQVLHQQYITVHPCTSIVIQKDSTHQVRLGSHDALRLVDFHQFCSPLDQISNTASKNMKAFAAATEVVPQTAQSKLYLKFLEPNVLPRFNSPVLFSDS